MIFTQFSAAPGAIEPDPVDALAACVADPVACRVTFSKVLVDLSSSDVPADRRVLVLIGQAFAKGPQGGANPFFVTSFAADIVRIHADADPDLAAELLIQAADALLRDAAAAQLNQGPDGFFAHAIDGIDARLTLRIPAPSADLRARAIAVLRRMAALAFADTAQRARTTLGRLGEPVTAPALTPVAPIAPKAPAAATSGLTSRAKIGAFALGLGAAVVATMAFFIGKNMHEPEPAPASASAFGKRKHRRRRVL